MNTLQRLIFDIITAHNERKDKSLTADQFSVLMKRINTRISSLRLDREKFACNQVIMTLFQDHLTNHLVMGYEYNGELYTVGRAQVPGCRNTDELHDNQSLTCDEWNKLAKFFVWKDTGIIESKIK